jgi:hypothetical protein
VGIWSRELNTDTHASAHLPGRGSLKNKVGVKLDDRGKSAGLRVMACMKMTQFEHDVFQLCARVLFGLQEPHPHVVRMVIDNEQAVAESMGGRDIDMGLDIRGKVQRRAGQFRARGGVARCKSSLVEQT